MTPPTATLTPRTSRSRSRERPHERRRQRLRRRRRVLGAVTVLGVIAVIVVLSMPLAKRAVNEFGLPLRYSADIRQQAAEKHLDPALVAAVIYAETKFDARTSAAGAMGLMQVEPGTAAEIARRSGATTFTTSDLNTPAVNIAYGSYLLRELLTQYHGSTTLALAAYNGGSGNVDRWEHDAEAHGHQLQISEIPFPETRAYVTRVLHAQHKYRRTYPKQLGYG